MSTGKRLLIVDDNATNRRILTLQTRAWGMLPRETASPAEALGWIKRGDPFDAAILDMHMPEMDGLALAREIREFSGNLPLAVDVCEHSPLRQIPEQIGHEERTSLRAGVDEDGEIL